MQCIVYTPTLTFDTSSQTITIHKFEYTNTQSGLLILYEKDNIAIQKFIVHILYKRRSGMWKVFLDKRSVEPNIYNNDKWDIISVFCFILIKINKSDN